MPRIPNHKLFDTEKEDEKESYYYSLIFLFVPFRDESSLLLKDETAEQAFHRLLPGNNDCSVHHDKLQRMLNARLHVKDINRARENEEKVKPDDENPELFGEAKNAMDELFDMNKHQGTEFTLDERVRMLNADQLRIFKKIRDHLVHQQLHESKSCICELKPLCMFVSGVGGTGKSFLIEAVKLLINDLWPSKKLRCAVAAPTGLASFNVGGVTIHRLFQLPIEHDGKTAGYWALSKEAQKVMKTYLNNVKMFEYLRLEELFSTNNWFGGRNMLFVGDILQLPPVNGKPVYDIITTKTLAYRLGCATSVNIWNNCIVYDDRAHKDKKWMHNSQKC